MIAGTVTVAEDTILQLHGKVDGDIVNRGGYPG